MQLNRLVNFHKALADPIRIKILTLLVNEPLHGQALAGKLGVSPPTITHHMKKLRDVGLVKEKREKNTVYFHLQHKVLEQNAQDSVKTIFKNHVTEEEEQTHMKQQHQTSPITDRTKQIEQEKAEVLRNFLTPDGRLKNIPAQRKKKLIVFEFLVKKLHIGHKYTEAELNEFIKQYHADYATIRREFIINHYMYRENSIYEVNPAEMWAKID